MASRTFLFPPGFVPQFNPGSYRSFPNARMTMPAASWNVGWNPPYASQQGPAPAAEAQPRKTLLSSLGSLAKTVLLGGTAFLGLRQIFPGLKKLAKVALLAIGGFAAYKLIHSRLFKPAEAQ